MRNIKTLIHGFSSLVCASFQSGTIFIKVRIFYITSAENLSPSKEDILEDTFYAFFPRSARVYSDIGHFMLEPKAHEYLFYINC